MPASIVRAFAPSMIDPFRRPVRNGLGWELGDGMGRNLTAGSWNAQIYEPLGAVASASTDQFLAKNRMSGMWSESQPLPRYLRESGHRTLLFAGVNTDQCVLGTLIDAYSAGWDCVLLEDCCATPTDGQATTVKNIAVSFFFFFFFEIFFFSLLAALFFSQPPAPSSPPCSPISYLSLPIYARNLRCFPCWLVGPAIPALCKWHGLPDGQGRADKVGFYLARWNPGLRG